MKKLIIALCIALSGCKIDIDRHVLLIGDSLMAQSLSTVQQDLLQRDDIGFFPMSMAIGGTTASHSGSGLEYWPQRAPLIYAKHQVDDVVISLGINDIGGPTDSFYTYVAAIYGILEAYSANGAEIYWILPHKKILSSQYHANQEIQLETFRAIIINATADFPNLHVLDFELYANLQNIPANLVFAGDNIHLSPDGINLWSRMIGESLGHSLN